MAWEVAIKGGVSINALPGSSASSALKADLVDGVVPLSELPADLDDVLEYANLAAFPVTGASGKIYIAADSSLPYRWTGSTYVPVSSAVTLGTTETTAFRGDYGNDAYQHSQATGNAHGLTKADLSIGNVDNTSDADKPISTLTAAALALKADLVNGVIPANQLPSYVDDVLEFETLQAFPATGEPGKIYVATGSNLTYRWTGSTYAGMSSALALGETAATAFRGDYGAAAYAHSQATGNPHGTTKADLLLGNVDNTADADKPISSAVATALQAKAPTSHTHVLADLPATLLQLLPVETVFPTSYNGPSLRLINVSGDWSGTNDGIYVDTGSALIAVDGGGGGSTDLTGYIKLNDVETAAPTSYVGPCLRQFNLSGNWTGYTDGLYLDTGTMLIALTGGQAGLRLSVVDAIPASPINGMLYLATTTNPGFYAYLDGTLRDLISLGGGARKLSPLEVTASGTLTVGRMNVVTGATALTLTLPTMSAGDTIGLWCFYPGHTINYDGTRLIRLADGTTATTLPVLPGEQRQFVLMAFGTTYVGA